MIIYLSIIYVRLFTQLITPEWRNFATNSIQTRFGHFTEYILLKKENNLNSKKLFYNKIIYIRSNTTDGEEFTPHTPTPEICLLGVIFCV